MLEILPVTEEAKKPVGGAREGAGRPREGETAFSLWAKEKGHTSKDLAALLGVKYRMANLLLAGKARPGLEALAKLDQLAKDEQGRPLFPAEYWINITKSQENKD